MNDDNAEKILRALALLDQAQAARIDALRKSVDSLKNVTQQLVNETGTMHAARLAFVEAIARVGARITLETGAVKDAAAEAETTAQALETRVAGIEKRESERPPPSSFTEEGKTP